MRKREYHGGKGTRLYTIWKGMRNRCFNPREPRYRDYGGRGIVVDEVWEYFSSFRSWALENGYEESLSLDRIDNDKDYGPSNCQWATTFEQARNSRHVHLLEAFGESKPISVWAEDERCLVSYHTLKKRIRDGWPAEAAITMPPVYDRAGVARKLGEKTWQRIPLGP